MSKFQLLRHLKIATKDNFIVNDVTKLGSCLLLVVSTAIFTYFEALIYMMLFGYFFLLIFHRLNPRTHNDPNSTYHDFLIGILTSG